MGWEYEHMYYTLEHVRDVMPYDDVSVVHEYGCGDGAGLGALEGEWDRAEVTGYDIVVAPGVKSGNVYDPAGYADIIFVLNLFESNQVMDIEKAIDILLNHCRYLVIGVHTRYSQMPRQVDYLYTKVYSYSGCANGRPDKKRHRVYVLDGRL